MLFRTRPNRPDLDAIKVPTCIDIAWSAGVYEGEGTVRLCGRGKRSLAANVAQKDPEILYRLRDWFGGSIGNPSGGNCCHKWDICGDRARIFLAIIYPYLSARRKAQIDSTQALAFMRGASVEGCSVDKLRCNLLSYYEEHRLTTWRGNNAVRREHYRKVTKPKRENAKVISIA